MKLLNSMGLGKVSEKLGFGPKLGSYTRLSNTARVDQSVVLGHWTEVGAGARVGRGSVLGDWAKVHELAEIGQNVTLGDRAQVGAGARVGDGSVLGSYTRVQPGVIVPEGAVLEDNDLVTATGVVSGRCSGFMFGCSNGVDWDVSCFAGNFRVPGEVIGSDSERVEEIIDDYMWGRNDDLERYRQEREPEPDLPRA